MGDTGEVVDGGVAVGEVARLEHGLRERHVTSDSFGIALAEVERDEILDGDPEASGLAAAGAVPPGAQVAHGQGRGTEDARCAVVGDLADLAAAWRR